VTLPDLSTAESLLAVLHGLFAAALLSSFGAALFYASLLPQAAVLRIAGSCRAVLRVSLIAAFFAGGAWLLGETHAIAGTQGLAQTLAMTQAVLFGTSFGRVLALQGLALAASAAALAFGRRAKGLAAGFAGAAVLLEAGHSHAFARADGLTLLLASQAAHLLAAGAWLGGLLPLLIVVRAAPLVEARQVALRFSRLGSVAVAILVVTAACQAFLLAGGIAGLTGTAYGTLLMVKVSLFAGLLTLAALNRFRLTPALAHPQGEASRRALAWSIGAEAALGLCIVLAAGVLASLEPGVQ
jgi:putative copper resistance protein D